jgi:hypothetical protein
MGPPWRTQDIFSTHNSPVFLCPGLFLHGTGDNLLTARRDSAGETKDDFPGTSVDECSGWQIMRRLVYCFNDHITAIR